MKALIFFVIVFAAVPAVFAQQDQIQHFKIKSKLLSDFWKKEMFIEAGVVLPGNANTEVKPPLCINIHGFGGNHRTAWYMGRHLIDSMQGGETPSMIYVYPNAQFEWGHHEFADSAHNGPFGEAFITEFIPALEKKYGAAGVPEGRLLTGHSSGGWSSLWLQVAYPDFFGGAWSISPDSVDFRHFSGVNIYDWDNFYFDPEGLEVPLIRRQKQWLVTIKQFSQREFSRSSHGGQIASFDAVFSPRGPDNLPLPLFDHETGKIDHNVAKAWEKYDISLVLRNNWKELRPKLKGKIRIYCGTMDTFRLEGAVKILKAELIKLKSDAQVVLVKGRDHGNILAPYKLLWPDGLMKMIHTDMYQQYKTALNKKGKPSQSSFQGKDWPQWRGEDRDGLWKENGVIDKFKEKDLKIKWRAKISGGYSGPTVANGKVYITDRIKDPDEAERVLCFDAMTGRPKWSHTYGCKYKKVSYTAGPRASVSVDRGKAYSLGTMGALFCFDADSGKVLWKKDLQEEYSVKPPIWGLAASPLVEGGLVIVMMGGKEGACIAAFDSLTGEERWLALDDSASYSAPILIEQAGKKVLVCWAGSQVAGLDPMSGKIYWRHPFKPRKMVINIATPVFHNNYLFLSDFYSGSLLLKVDPSKMAVKEIWRRKGANERRTDSLHCCISTPLLFGEHIYGVDSYGELRCLDLLTGDRVWESLAATRNVRWGNIHMTMNEDKVWMFNEMGELIISTLSEEGFNEISRASLIKPTLRQLNQRGGVCWSHPAFAYKHIYARNDEELVCADLSIPKGD